MRQPVAVLSHRDLWVSVPRAPGEGGKAHQELLWEQMPWLWQPPSSPEACNIYHSLWWPTLVSWGGTAPALEPRPLIIEFFISLP